MRLDPEAGLHCKHRTASEMMASSAGARSWVQEQLREHGGDLWISGAEDYARHARDLLQDFADVISRRNEDSGATAQGPVPTSGAVLRAGILREASGCRRTCSAHVQPASPLMQLGGRAAQRVFVPVHLQCGCCARATAC